jgi:hypothetical protein
MAERLGARTPQLRAAGRLCAIAADEERPARLAALRAVHASFSEGLAAPDLVEAAALLG